jgi:hypothetical protein
LPRWQVAQTGSGSEAKEVSQRKQLEHMAINFIPLDVITMLMMMPFFFC